MCIVLLQVVSVIVIALPSCVEVVGVVVRIVVVVRLQ
jgi:hypothetical protein